VAHRVTPAANIAFALVVLLTGCTATATSSTPIENSKASAIATVQDYLAGEHAAIWAYGRAAVLLPKAELRLALETANRHRRERDQLARELRSAGATPVGALVAYDEGSALENAEQARAFLAGVEARLTTLALAVKGIPS